MTQEHDVQWFQRGFNVILRNIETVVRSDTDKIRLALTCILAEGHLLLEDKPGTGKTTLAKAISASVKGQFERIQFTPDTLPSDVTGGEIFNQKTGDFLPKKGPVFTNILLADEINRASPKTQAAMLEAMEERQVTIGKTTEQLPKPFVVIATQNPEEQHGTYPLPEAQLDRFLIRMSLGYPSLADTVEIIKDDAEEHTPETLRQVATTTDLIDLIRVARNVHTAEPVLHYAASLCEATRSRPELRLGASPRGAIALIRTARVIAASQGKDFVSPADIKSIAPAVLSHRLILDPRARSANRSLRTSEIVERVLVDTPAPAVTKAAPA